MTEAATTSVFLCFGDPEECIACGGWTKCDPMPGEERGPFVAPEGSLAPGNYCSERCWAEWEENLRLERAKRKNMLRLCHLCGFDRQDRMEHADGCLMAGVDDHRRQVQFFGERGHHWHWTGAWYQGGDVAWHRDLEYGVPGCWIPFTVTVAA